MDACRQQDPWLQFLDDRRLGQLGSFQFIVKYADGDTLNPQVTASAGCTQQ